MVITFFFITASTAKSKHQLYLKMRKVLLISLLFTSILGFSQETVEEYTLKFESAKSDSLKAAYAKKIASKYYMVDNDQCIKFARIAADYYTLLNDDENKGHALQYLGFALEQSGKNDEGLKAQQESIRLLVKAGKYKLALASYSGASYCLEKQGRFNEALKYVLESLELIDKHNLPDENKAKNLVDLGRIYRINRQEQKAIEVYNQALMISFKEGDHKTAGVILMNIGNVYTQLEDFSHALEYHKKALVETKLCDCKGRMTQVWSNIGFTQFQLTRPDSVRFAARNAEKYLVDKNDLNAKTDIHLLHGLASFAEEDYKGSLPHLEKALALAKKNQNSQKVMMVKSVLEHCYLNLEEPEKAKAVVTSALSEKDSIYSDQMAKEIAALEIEYETKLKEKELAELNKQNALKQEYIEKIKRRNNGLIALFILSLILAVLSLFLLRKSRHTSKDLQIKLVELDKLYQQKKLLLKEIHHRVKNNLQTVSSLLNLQTRATNDVEVKKAMMEGQSRLKSISLLHQKLYQHEQLTKIEMDDYIHDLSTYIIKNFNQFDKDISLKTFANGLALDLDTAIPLGLILNELITNSIKYSFEKSKQGEIEVMITKLNDDNEYELHVSNNGLGLPENLDIDSLKSMGLKLVKSLSRQIHGSFKAFTDDKAHFVINFKETIS